MNPIEPVTIEPMLWIPGQGPDPARLQKLTEIFDRPTAHFYEPGFVEETQHEYENINRHGIRAVSNDELSSFVERLVSNLAIYGGLGPWPEWYAYVTPRILSSRRGHDLWSQNQYHTGLIALSLCNPNNFVTRYEADFASALAPWIMQPAFWNRGRYLPLQEEWIWSDSWGIVRIVNSISVSLLFTWRYLHPKDLRAWLHSVLAVKDARWRAHFIVWLMKIWPFFEQRASNYAVLKACDIDEELWNGFSTLLLTMDSRPERQQWNLVPPENISALQIAIRQEFTPRRYFEWIEQFAAQPEVWPQMELWLEQMQAKFL
jgi:hypothetical protein